MRKFLPVEGCEECEFYGEACQECIEYGEAKEIEIEDGKDV